MTLVKIRKDDSFEQYGYDPKTQAILDYREFYPLEYLEKVFQKLKIKNDDHKYEFIEQICHAADSYSQLKQRKHKRFTKAYQVQELKKLQNALCKVITAIEKIEPEYFIGSYAGLVHDKFDVLIQRDRKFRDSLSQNLLSQHAQIRLAAKFEGQMLLGLRKLYEASKSVSEKELGNFSSYPYTALSFWLRLIADPWIKYSKIPLTAGQYHRGIGYNSDALYVLRDIISPIDKRVTLQNLATELRCFAKNEAKAKRR